MHRVDPGVCISVGLLQARLVAVEMEKMDSRIKRFT